MSRQRVLFKDIKPYEAPDTLEQLQGPATGHITLPISIYWQPGRNNLNLDDQALAVAVYETVLREGTAEDQTKYLNKNLLINLWPDLVLPERVTTLWQTQFPQLRKTLNHAG